MATAKNYAITNSGVLANLGTPGREMMGEQLGITGCEISLNSKAPGEESAFLHHHQLNEEVYIVTAGGGTFTVDGEMFAVKPGSVVRIAPAGVRSMKAGDQGMAFVCIQAQHGSLTQATGDDGVLDT